MYLSGQSVSISLFKLGLTSSRRTKTKAIFSVPTGNDEWSNNWRENMVNVVTQNRVIDKILKDRTDRKNNFQRNSF